MKSKDQQLLEEAYQTILEGKYLNNYGMYRNVKHKGVTGDPALDAREADRNAGLEDDYVPSKETAAAPSTPTAQPAVEVDPSAFAGKNIGMTIYDPGEYVVTVDGKPTGGTFSKAEAETLVQALGSVEQDSSVMNHPLVQSWIRGAKNLGDL
jgi:hypothetical protein